MEIVGICAALEAGSHPISDRRVKLHGSYHWSRQQFTCTAEGPLSKLCIARDQNITFGPYVCVGCCSQLRIWHDFGNRSYVSGLLIGSRAVALMGLRTRLGLISGKVFADHKGRQTLGAYFLRSMLSSLSRTPFDRGKRQMVSMAISLGASNRVPCRRTLHAVRASLLASATAALLRGMRFTASLSQAPKLKADHLF